LGLAANAEYVGTTGDAPEKIPYAIQRFVGESLRIVGVLDTALNDSEFLAGDYSIADVATYPWIKAAWDPFQAMMPEKVGEMTGVARWLDAVGKRPAVVKGMAVPAVD
jgi:GST-like protein